MCKALQLLRFFPRAPLEQCSSFEEKNDENWATRPAAAAVIRREGSKLNPSDIYNLATFEFLHLPLIKVRSINPWVRYSWVAPPRRIEYGLNPRSCTWSSQRTFRKRLRKADPLNCQIGTCTRPWAARMSSSVCSTTSTLESVIVTLSVVLKRNPDLLRGIESTPWVEHSNRSAGRMVIISPVRRRQWKPRRSSKAITTSPWVRHQPAIARVISNGKGGARHGTSYLRQIPYKRQLLMRRPLVKGSKWCNPDKASATR